MTSESKNINAAGSIIPVPVENPGAKVPSSSSANVPGVKAKDAGIDWNKLLTSITSVAQLAGRSVYKRIKDNPYEVGGALLGATSFGLALKGAMQPEGKRKWPWYAGSAVTGLGSVASLVKSSRLNAKPLPPLDPNSMTIKNMDEIPDRPAPDVEDIAAKINAGSSVLGLKMHVDKEQARKLYWTARIFKRNRNKAMFTERVMDVTKGGDIHPDDLEMVMNMPLDPTKAPELLNAVTDQLIKVENVNAQKESENSKSISKADIARLNEERRRRKGI